MPRGDGRGAEHGVWGPGRAPWEPPPLRRPRACALVPGPGPLCPGGGERLPRQRVCVSEPGAAPGLIGRGRRGPGSGPIGLQTFVWGRGQRPRSNQWNCCCRGALAGRAPLKGTVRVTPHLARDCVLGGGLGLRVGGQWAWRGGRGNGGRRLAVGGQRAGPSPTSSSFARLCDSGSGLGLPSFSFKLQVLRAGELRQL